MRELRTCDFCGTDAVGVFEVLPPELTPAADQRRVVLCDHCEETLTDVIAPLLRRLDVDADVDEQHSSARQSQSVDVELPDDASAETGASPTTNDSSSAGSAASVDVDAVDAAPTPPEPADHDSPDDDEVGTADPLDADSAQRDDAGGDEDEVGETNEETGVDEDEALATGEDAETSEDTETDEDTETSEDAEPSSEEGDSDDRPSEPPKFRKVVRILQNREFPVERADVEALASNAYDLDDDQVTEIFDYAVERGLLVDDDGTLRKP